MIDYRRMVAQVAEILDQPFEQFYPAWMSINDGRLDGRFGSSEGDILAMADLLDMTIRNDQTSGCMTVRRSITRKFLTPKSGVVQMLEKLRDVPVKIGLVTDCVYDVPAVWAESELAQFFTALHFSCETHIRKPDARAYEAVLRQLDVDAKDSLFVGDGGSDELHGALRAGLDALKIDDLRPVDGEMLRVGVADWNGPVVKDIRGIFEYVQRATCK